MRKSLLSYVLPVLLAGSGIAVFASAVHMASVEWRAEHRTPWLQLARPLGQDDRSPAERIDTLQRELNEMDRSAREVFRARAEQHDAAAYLQISSALMFSCAALMAYQRRRSAKAAAVKGKA